MSNPREPEPVKLISSLFSPIEKLVYDVIRELEGIFGPTDWISPRLLFDRTKYYAREMGWPLQRRFISFQELARPEAIVETKLTTNDVESKHLEDGKRRVNIDPGYISLERLVLATGKNYIHRIYLSKGIYADLTLIFRKGTFKPLDWTYRDYADPVIIGYFNDLREIYFRQLRGFEN
jgi:hypothetical protein